MFLIRMILSAFRSLRANFARSILAILGIIVGVGTVIAAVGVVEGATRDWLNDMKKVGPNTMWISPGGANVRGRREASVKRLDAGDVEEIRMLPSVSAAAGEYHAGGSVKFRSKNEPAAVVGTQEQFFDVFSYRAAEGRLLTKADVHIGRRVATIGHELAEKLFDKRNPIGEEIRLGKHAFEVVGVMEEKGLVGFFDFDNQVYIPLTRAYTMYNPLSLTNISVRGSGDEENQAYIKSEVAGALRRRHRLQIGDDDDFTLTTQKELAEQFSKLTNIWQAVFFAISGISLVVGGFGIMNIMLVSVTERTREIGVRMAVGAQRNDILAQFLAESSMICVVGAPLGIGLGWMLNQVVEANLAPLQPVLAPKVVMIAVLVAIGTGLVSGLYPAWRAARLDPVDALRFE